MKQKEKHKIVIDNWNIHDAMNSLFGHINLSKDEYAKLYNQIYNNSKK